MGDIHSPHVSCGEVLYHRHQSRDRWHVRSQGFTGPGLGLCVCHYSITQARVRELYIKKTYIFLKSKKVFLFSKFFIKAREKPIFGSDLTATFDSPILSLALRILHACLRKISFPQAMTVAAKGDRLYAGEKIGFQEKEKVIM